MSHYRANAPSCNSRSVAKAEGSHGDTKARKNEDAVNSETKMQIRGCKDGIPVRKSSS